MNTLTKEEGIAHNARVSEIMKERPILDKWDIAAIQYCKRASYSKTIKESIDGLKNIWCVRNLTDLEDIHSSYLVSHFIEKIVQIKLFNADGMFGLIHAASPIEIWKYTSDSSICSMNYKEQERLGNTVSYYDRWLLVIISKFRNSPVADLPGYEATTKGDHEFYLKIKTFGD